MAEIGQDINKAAMLLNEGALVAIPTETVYGLAGNALKAEVVARIFDVKRRPHFDPLIMHLGSIEQLDNLTTQIPEIAYELAQKFWPGPLTLVLPKKEIVPDLVSAGLSTVAVRMPNHALTLELLGSLSFPLAAPSANPFGYISPTNAQHVAQQLGDDIDYILDGGPCEVGVESTIVGFEEMKPVLFRRGGIPQEQLEEVCGPLKVVLRSSNPSAPGMLDAHYAPRTPLRLSHDISLDDIASNDIGRLCFKTKHPQLPSAQQLVLSPSGNLTEAAQNLFAYLRLLDEMPIKIIFAEPVPDEGLGKAINDRLSRASH